MEESFLTQGLQNIKRTQEALTNLQAKMVQYMTKSKDPPNRRHPQPQFIMPIMGFDFASRQESRLPSHHSSPHQQPAHVKVSPQKELVSSNLEGEYEYYRRKLLEADQTSSSMSKIEEFYQKRTELLEERVQQLESRRAKVKREKDLLAKQNRRIQQQIDGFRTSEKSKAKEALVQAKTLAHEGKLAKEQKIKDLRAEIEKEKHTEESLRTQLQSYETSLKLMLQLQKNLVSVDITSKQTKKPLNKGSKSRSTILKTAKNRHRQCCQSTTLQKSKSRSMITR